MPVSRGRTGDVRGMPAARVQQVFAEVVQDWIKPGTQFNRTGLRSAIQAVAEAMPGQEELTVKDLGALEVAFMRTVYPVRHEGARGTFTMPLRAVELVRHRDYRLALGRMTPADLLQFVDALRTVEHLTPNLERKVELARRALKHLGLPPQGEARRV